MTAPAVASTGAASSFSGTTISVGVPSGVVSGSLVTVWVAATWAESGTAPPSTAITPPAGFTLVAGSWTTNLDSAFSAYSAGGWYYKYASGSDSGTYAFTTSSVASTAAAGGGGYAQRITGGPTSGNPFTDSFHSGGRATVGLTFTVATFTPTAGNTLLVGGVIWDDDPSPSTYTNPTSWTSAAQASNGTIGEVFGVGYLQQTVAAATGTLTYTYGGSTGSPGMAVIGSIRTPSGSSFSDNAALSGSSVLTASAKPSVGTTAALSGSSGLTATAKPAVAAIVSLSGGSSLTVTAKPAVAAAAALSGASSLAAIASPSTAAVAALSGSSALTATAAPGVVSAASTSGTSTLTAIAAAQIAASAATSGTTSLTATGDGTRSAAAAFSGSGVLTVAAVAGMFAAAALYGSSMLSATHSNALRDITLTAVSLKGRWGADELGDGYTSRELAERWQRSTLPESWASAELAERFTTTEAP